MADPFEEFGGSAEPAPAAEAQTGDDPFAAFGGAVETAPATEPVAAEPTPEQSMLGSAVDTGRAWVEGLVGSVIPESAMARLEAINPFVAKTVTGQETSWDGEVEAQRKALAQRARDHGFARMGGNIVGTIGQAGIAAPAVAGVVKGAAKYLGSGMLGKALAAGTGLAVEGAGLGAVEAARDEIGRAIETGDWKSAAEHLPLDLVKKAAATGAWNIAGATVLHGVTKLGGLALKSIRGSAQKAVEAADDRLVAAYQSQTADAARAAQESAAQAEILEQTRPRLDPADAGDNNLLKAAAELDESLQRALPKPIVEPADEVARYAQAYEGARSFAAHADESAPKLKQALDTILENGEYADQYLALGAKRSFIKALEQPETAANAVTATKDVLNPFAARLREEAATALDDAMARKLNGLAAKSEKAISLFEAKAPEKLGDAFEILDELKSEIGRVAKNSRGTLQRAANEQYEVLRQFMEREDLFGAAGALQKPFNAVWAPEISADGASAIQGMTLRTGRKEAFNKFAAQERVDAAWLERHLKDIGNDSAKDEALRQWIATKVASQSVRADLLGNAEGLRRAAEGRKAMQQALEILDTNAAKKAGARSWKAIEEQLQAEQLFNAAVPNRKEQVGRFVGNTAAGMAGLGGLKVGDYVAGKVTASQLTKDLEAARKVALNRERELRTVAEKAATEARKAQKALDRAVRKAASRTTWTTKVEQTVEQVTPAARAGARKILEQLQQEPADQSGPLSALTPMLGPDLAQAYLEQQQARDDYLRSKLPQPASPQFGADALDVSDDELDTLARYADAADNPTDALDRVASGLGTAEDIDALRTLYPSRLQELRSAVTAKMTSGEWTYDEGMLALNGMGLTGLSQSPGTSAFWSEFAAAEKQLNKPEQGVKNDIAAAEGQSLGSALG